ncbi:MAG: hypothetical protein M3Y33_17295 [Actinomycetota bacterium]|nr:hypothetical protein [Actinomycetota bacterium]
MSMLELRRVSKVYGQGTATRSPGNARRMITLARRWAASPAGPAREPDPGALARGSPLPRPRSSPAMGGAAPSRSRSRDIQLGRKDRS